MKILDIGCGAGMKAKYFTEKNFQVTGIDFSENMIELAKKNVPQAKFQVLDLFDVNSLDEKFDCVFAQAVLLHIPKNKIKEAIKNLASVLKPDGYFYVGVKAIKEDRIEEKMITENDYGYEYERFFSFFSGEELEKIFTGQGFKVIWSEIPNSDRSRWIQMIAT